jgi:carbon-monoxide dehydrogenase large subunit
MWASNIRAAGTCYAVFVRSPMAHARIFVDVQAARAAAGVLAVWTASQVSAGVMPPLGDPLTRSLNPPLAVDEVRYVGDPVVVVVARTHAQAIDAAELVNIDYTPLPAVASLANALLPDAPLVHADTPGNVAFDDEEMNSGDIDAALANAEILVRRTFVHARVAPGAMEPRAAVVVPDGGGFIAHISTQAPHIVRYLLSKGSGIPEELIRVVAQDVGGGFGGKFFYPEELVLLLLAHALGRPVSWTATRSEDLATTYHARALEQEVTIAATKTGQITGLDVRLTSDVGAYPTVLGFGVASIGAGMYPGIYRIENFRLRSRGVLTNKAPVGAYRGAGRPEATFAIERILDELAAELETDPVELRRRNWITADTFPYLTAGGNTFDVGDFEATLERACELVNLPAVQAQRAERQKQAASKRIGIGFSTYIEGCGGGGIVYSETSAETAEVRLTVAGGAEVVTGTTSYGMGHATTWAQIINSVLGIPVASINVVQGDTQRAPNGYDSYGSRSLSVGGSAILRAAEAVRDRAIDAAAQLLEAEPEDISFQDGVLGVRGTSITMTIQEIALASYRDPALTKNGVDPGLGCIQSTDLSYQTYPFGAHIAVVEVDTETGEARVINYVAVDDVGHVVNPQIVEGQVHGGIAQGIAQALYEEAAYDASGNFVIGTLSDYGMPSAADLPSLVTDRCVTPTTANPLGAKGVGETGAIAAPPAVINAVIDALRPLGVQNLPMPATPARIWEAINQAALPPHDRPVARQNESSR